MHDDTPIRPPRFPMDRQHWARSQAVWYAFPETDEGDPDLPTNRKPPGRAALLGHTKIESTVRYLGIEVDDAVAIAEQVDV